MTGTLGASQAVTLEEAAEICTLEGAHVLGVEDELGSIEVGKFGDMIVLDQDLFEIGAHDIYGTQVMQSIIGGEVVCDRNVQGNEDVDHEDMLDRLQ